MAHRTPVLILQHPRERRHPLGTVRIARLGLSRCRVEVAWRSADDRVSCPPVAAPGAALLYPSPDARVLEPGMPDPPRALVAVDGTWPCARKLIRDNPWVAALPRVRLAPSRPGRYRIRKARKPQVELSTIEALVEALRILEPESKVETLLEAFDAMIDRHIALASRKYSPRYVPTAQADP